jgi:hypothetical protein
MFVVRHPKLLPRSKFIFQISVSDLILQRDTLAFDLRSRCG